MYKSDSNLHLDSRIGVPHNLLWGSLLPPYTDRDIRSIGDSDFDAK